ncbi:MAG: glycine cleavage system protein GcvH [Burkholderiales bacterium]|nr:glycine cleavage system protein GcvH [Burkholderiales bacterium]MCE7876591.1 glycine cleavage system protein GcvH [Betaproteobacteria bacterium PRO3]
MKIPAELRYTSSHEWLRRESDGTITIGITDHAQSQLGDLVFVELPAAGRKVAAGEACAVVESVKAASDVYAPVAGTVVAANDAVPAAPESVNQDAFAAWLFRIRPDDPAAMDALLDARGYQAVIGD